MTYAPGLPDPIHDAQFYAGVSARRLVAFLIDFTVIAVLAVLTTLAFGVATLGIGFALAAPIGAVVGFLYRYLTIARASATPGMALVGVELRRRDGERFDAWEAAIHTALFTVMFVTVLPQIVSVAMMAVGRDGRGLHDAALGSALINRPA